MADKPYAKEFIGNCCTMCTNVDQQEAVFERNIPSTQAYYVSTALQPNSIFTGKVKL